MVLIRCQTAKLFVFVATTLLARTADKKEYTLDNKLPGELAADKFDSLVVEAAKSNSIGEKNHALEKAALWAQVLSAYRINMMAQTIDDIAYTMRNQSDSNQQFRP